MAAAVAKPEQILVRWENHRTFLVTLPPPPEPNHGSADEDRDTIAQQQQWVLARIISSLQSLTLAEHEQQKQLTCQKSAASAAANNPQHLPPHDDENEPGRDVVFPVLEISHWSPPFCNCRCIRRIRGGKGGFGTLLKGQSRQASAKTTTNFGACRDLQGRRLRHVNDAIHEQLIREWQERIQAGTGTVEEMATALLQTDTGIAGWHLPVPAWADVSAKKERQKTLQQLRLWKRSRDTLQQQRQQQQQLRERQVALYVEEAEQVTTELEQQVSAALQQGLLRHQQAAQQQQQTTHDSTSEGENTSKRLKTLQDWLEPPAGLLTLSGDVVLEATEEKRWRLQSQSNFCTVAIVLDHDKMMKMTQQQQQQQQQQQTVPSAVVHQWYYELVVVTGGLVQVGWARLPGFRPDSEGGDGVGDCQNSWGFDGSRSLQLHGGQETTTTTTTNDALLSSWKAGDVVGCGWDPRTGELSFRVNGRDAGVALTVGAAADNKSKTNQEPILLYPVVSCNPGEIVELRLHESEMEYLSSLGEGVMAVGTVMATEDVTLESFFVEEQTQDIQHGKEEKQNSIPSEDQPVAAVVERDSKPAAVVPEPLDLEQYSSIETLEQLGLDRLKSALMALGLKCGGTLSERAARLWSVRGLQPPDFPPKLLAKAKR